MKSGYFGVVVKGGRSLRVAPAGEQPLWEMKRSFSNTVQIPFHPRAWQTYRFFRHQEQEHHGVPGSTATGIQLYVEAQR